MKLRAKYSFTLLVTVIAIMVASCATAPYKQNKYRKNNRYHNSCGCMMTTPQDNYSLTLNEQK